MTKKQLTDALCKALFGNDFINKDCDLEEGFERLGYVNVEDTATADGHEPVLLYVNSNGVELHWMFDEDHGVTDVASYLRGIIHIVAPFLKVEDTDTRDLVFGYTLDVE